MKAAIPMIALLLTAPSAHAAQTRSVFFISDLHMGVGHVAGGGWDPFEDFRWTGDFAAFLDELDRRGNGHADLVLNGDTFELWQSHDVPCNYHDDNLGCTEDDARHRAERIAHEHAADLRLLGAFAAKHDNRVVLVPGNHDVALFWPTVRQLLVAAMQAPAGRIAFSEDGIWRSSDGLIIAEHGQQIGADPNRFQPWPNPLVSDGDGKRHMRRPWGEQFVQAFYNHYEMSFPIIDNFPSDGDGLRLAIKAAGAGGTLHAIGHFLKFLILQESRQQFAQILGDHAAEQPHWDVQAMRARKERFLLESIPEDDELYALAKAAVDSGTMEVSSADTEQLSDEEIRAICDARAAVKKADPHAKLSGCPGHLGGAAGTLGALRQSITMKRDAVFRTHLLDLHSPALRVFVFSHTHKAETFSLKHPDVAVLNTGAWQRLISKDRVDALAHQQHFHGASDAFSHMSPDNLDACYTFVEIPPYTDTPAPSLMTWQSVGGHFAASTAACPWSRDGHW